MTGQLRRALDKWDVIEANQLILDCPHLLTQATCLRFSFLCREQLLKLCLELDSVDTIPLSQFLLQRHSSDSSWIRNVVFCPRRVVFNLATLRMLLRHIRTTSAQSMFRLFSGDPGEWDLKVNYVLTWTHPDVQPDVQLACSVEATIQLYSEFDIYIQGMLTGPMRFEIFMASRAIACS